MKPLKILLVEDEPGAAANLKAMLSNLVPDFQLLAILPSVEEAVEWLRVKGSYPDLGGIHQGGGGFSGSFHHCLRPVCH